MEDRVDALDRLPERAGVVEVAAHGGRVRRQVDVAADERAAVGVSAREEAAARLGIDRTTMVSLLDSLEGKDLVARRPDAGDRRRNVVVLTDAGKAKLRAATNASDARHFRPCADLAQHQDAGGPFMGR